MHKGMIGKALCALIPVLIGIYLAVRDYINILNHPEWSVSPSVVWIEFGIGLLISLVLFFFLFKQKK